MGSVHMLIVLSALTDFCYPQPPLEIVQSPAALVQPEGSRCTLHCSARGVTDGAISWYRLDAGGGLRQLVKSLAPGFHGSPAGRFSGHRVDGETYLLRGARWPARTAACTTAQRTHTGAERRRGCTQTCSMGW
ncbi:hypothetical protein AAFF_G00214470 [Aldrovandia affinis]|uniref:Ig-like domain-containing protein n=1 Tax=Aldrovandia affinis TaxID=143900 RepID=A0AAD7W4W5_9TELE|nr:hypothetical protein AAFF_G00214470 [Aldrovandia affinis]